MSVTEKEAVASLELLVAIAKADGSLAPEERAVLEDTLKGAKLPGGLTVDALLGGTYDVDALASQITSQEARDAAFSSAFAMAYADRTCLPEEQAILAKLERAWTVPKEKAGFFKKLVS